MGKDGTETSSDISIEKEGFISQSLSKDGIPYLMIT
jgi:NAD(P)H-quinone oxidoreductase subunit J